MQYAFDLESTHWMRVPREFPDGDAQDVFAWASSVGDALAPGDPELRRALVGRATELSATSGPRADAAERLWLLPSSSCPEAIAHLYFAEADDQPTEVFALAGTDGGVQSMRPVEGTRFDEALAAEVLAETEVGLLVISRRIGRVGGTIALLEVIDGSPSPVSVEDGPLDALLRGLIVRAGEA